MIACTEHKTRTSILLPLNLAHRRLRDQAAAAACEGFLAALLPFSGNRARGIDIPALRPVTERIAVPWRLRRERGQLQLLPDRTRMLHEFARGQRERRRHVSQRCVDEDGRLLVAGA